MPPVWLERVVSAFLSADADSLPDALLAMIASSFWTTVESVERPASRVILRRLPDWDSENFSIDFVPSTEAVEATVSAPVDSRTVRDVPPAIAFVRAWVFAAILPSPLAVPVPNRVPGAAWVIGAAREPVELWP